MKIAIIGTGIAGNAAAWILNQAHDITLYEQNDYIGGNSNTVSIPGYGDIDTNFIIYNEATNPNLIRLFDHLDIACQKTDMSFAVSLNNGKLEYSSESLFAQMSNVVRPGFHSMWLDTLRFYREAPRILKTGQNISIGEYLKQNSYSKSFIHHHILPLAAAIWSSSTEDIRHFPVQSFVRFFLNHGLLQLKNRPAWWTVTGGSKNYVQALTKDFQHKIRLNTKVENIERHKEFVLVNDEAYDHVIIATHADQALTMLSDASSLEHEVLQAFPYRHNTAILHTDTALMPGRRKAWSTHNFLGSSMERGITLTYWMNRLQPFIGQENIFLTLNPATKPAPEKIIKEIRYAHPQFTMDSRKGWENIKSIQGHNRTWFCGGWCGYGFHEDSLTSGLTIAEALGGIKRPWTVLEKSPASMNSIA